jgi:chromosome segregation ATPase
MVVLLIGLNTSSCTNPGEVDKLKRENQELKKLARERDSTINSMIAAFNQVQENLALIREKQDVISINKLGNIESEEAREQINQDIRTINDLMEQNKQTISRLDKKLKNSNIKLAEFDKLLVRANRQIEEKNQEIDDLKGELVNLNFAVDMLNATVDTLYQETQEQAVVIDQQQQQLNTAYYVFGSEKELKENGVITKEGGFIGIGRIEKLMQDFNKDYFTKIDITKVNSIPLYMDEARVLTVHPSETYNLKKSDDKIESLEITNPQEFWKTSRYLVIIVD